MKQIFTCLFLIAIFSYSCQKGFSIDTTTGTGGGGTGGGGGSVLVPANCKSCEFIPMCNGIRFEFIDSSGSTPAVILDTLKYLGDSTASGTVFQKFYLTGRKSNTFNNCNSGVTRQISSDVISFGPLVLNGLNIIVLKANDPVNATWTDLATTSTGQNIELKSKIVAKGASRALNGINFTDVTHVQVEIGITLPLFGFTPLAIMDNYFAKGVGLIENKISDANLGTIIQKRTLKSYYIP